VPAARAGRATEKLAAVACYRTQFPPAKGHVLERIHAFALQQGQAAGFSAGNGRLELPPP